MLEHPPTNILDVADYFLTKESMTHKKLQKLCYYAQAWYLANCGRRLFSDYFEAWVHGPVSPRLYERYRGSGWTPIPKKENILLDRTVSSFLDRVYDVYGEYDGDTLEQITHREEPWKKARIGYEPRENCNNIISELDMLSYYKRRIEKDDGS